MTEKTAIPGLPDTINTDRLLLRVPVLADAPALTELANNWEIHKFLARLPYPYTRDHGADFITNLARTNEEHAFAIINEQSNFVGVIGLHLNHGEDPELGYWLGQPFWGKGYATEAALGVVQAAVRAGFSRLTARSITENKGSVGVLLKAGFVAISEGIDDCGQHKGVRVTRFLWEKQA